ncbi:hypothetical protein HK102_001982 [Quaeritorhiza haematococci]|nr:hypothetical protein HK102_001982 [Quaeritorhiza haematococci]
MHHRGSESNSRPRPKTTNAKSAASNLTSLPPEILLNIVLYLSNRRDFAAFTSTCRPYRSLFTANVWASCLITKHGKADALKVFETYGRYVADAMPLWIWFRRNIQPKPACYKFGAEDVVKDLVRRGCCLDVTLDEDENYILTWAIAREDVELVQMLVGRGVTDKDRGLVQAALVPNANLVRILRDEGGADVHYNDNEAMFGAIEYGSTEDYHDAFHVVVENGDVELLKYLLDNGLEFDIFEDDFPDLALRNGNMDMYDFLIQHAMQTEEDKEELMVRAVRTNFAGLLKAIIQLGVSVEDVDRKLSEAGETGLLETAMIVNAYRVVPTLAETLDVSDSILLTAIHVTHNHPDIAKTLLRHTSENTSIPKETLLAVAVNVGNVDVVSCLLESDTNLDVSDETIIAAAEAGHTGLVKTLLKYSGKSSTVEWGAILSIATETGNKQLVNFLLGVPDDTQRQSLSDISDELVPTTANTGIF